MKTNKNRDKTAHTGLFSFHRHTSAHLHCCSFYISRYLPSGRRTRTQWPVLSARVLRVCVLASLGKKRKRKEKPHSLYRYTPAAHQIAAQGRAVRAPMAAGGHLMWLECQMNQRDVALFAHSEHTLRTSGTVVAHWQLIHSAEKCKMFVKLTETRADGEIDCTSRACTCI